MARNRLSRALSHHIGPKTRLLRVLLALALPLMVGAGLSAAQTPAGSRTFTETGKTVKGKFLTYWDGHGGLAQQGFPISEEMQEKSDTDGKTYTVQYFERAVFELHPENAAPNDVLLSLLGVFLYGQKYSATAPAQVANTSTGSRLFPETGKRVGGVFLAYWNSHGGLAQQGLPISDEFTEHSDLDHNIYTVQYFERAVFELHPENAPPYNVLLSQLGTFRYRDKYQHPAATPSPTQQAVPTATPEPGGSPGPVTEVRVVLSLKHIDPPQITVPAGRTRFIVTNTDTQFGQTRHNFRIYTDQAAVAAGRFLAGTPTFAPVEGAQTFEVTLAPGNYLTRCDVPQHAEAGMVGTLTVTGP